MIPTPVTFRKQNGSIWDASNNEVLRVVYNKDTMTISEYEKLNEEIAGFINNKYGTKGFSSQQFLAL